MADLKKVGGYGSAGLLFIVLAIYMFTKGMALPGIAVILVGAFALLGFHEFAAPRLRQKRQARETITSDEVMRRFQVIAGMKIQVEVSGEELVKEESRVITAVREVVKSAKKIVPKGMRKETFGEELEAVDAVRPEIEKRLDTLSAELDMSQRALSKVIDALHKEHSEIADKVRGVKLKKNLLSDLEDKLDRDVKKYKEVFEGVDSGGELSDRVKKLHELEEQIENQKKSEIGAEVFKELNRAQSYCNYLSHLKKRIEGTIHALKDSIPTGTKDEKYDSMMAKLDRMGQMIESDLVPSAHEHRRTVDAIWKKLMRFDDIIISLKQSELEILRVEHSTLAAEAETQSIESARKLKMLEDQVRGLTHALEVINKTKKPEAPIKDDQIDHLIQTWKADLKSAQVAAKKDPRLAKRVDTIINRNLEEQADLISSLVRTVMEQEEHTTTYHDLMNRSEEHSNELKIRVNSLETQAKQLKLAKDAAEQQMDELNARFVQLEQENQNAQQELSKTSEDEISNEFEERLRTLTSEIEDVRSKAAEAANAKTDLENDLRIAQSHLTEARQQIEEKAPELESVKDELRVTNEVLHNTKENLSKITKQRDMERKEADSLRDRLESDISDLMESMKRREKEIRNLQKEYDDQKEHSNNYIYELHKEAIAYAHLEEELDRAKENLDKQITEAIEAGEASKDIEKRFKKEIEALQEKFSRQLEDAESHHNAIQERLSKQLEKTNSINDRLAKDVADKARLASERESTIKDLQKLCEQTKQAADQAKEDTEVYIKDMLTPHIVKLKQEKGQLTKEFLSRIMHQKTSRGLDSLPLN